MKETTDGCEPKKTLPIPEDPSSAKEEVNNLNDVQGKGKPSNGLGEIQVNTSPDDLEFMSDTSAAMLIRTPKGGRMLIYTILGVFASAIIWASFASLDEITRGIGRVIPSSRLQIIQNLEGGILKKLLVREGQQVKAGELLLQLDDTIFKSFFREGETEYLGLLAKASRLKAELSGNELLFPANLANHSSYTSREIDVYKQRIATIKAENAITDKQIIQAKHELLSAHAHFKFLKTSYEFGAKELNITKPLAEKGIVSEIELLQLQQKVNDLQSEMRMAELSIPVIKAAYEEASARKNEKAQHEREEVVEDLKDIEVDLGKIYESQAGMKDKVDRTMVRAPLSGIVKKIHINTIGGVIKPGMDMMEIVPIEDTLLIEANINPKDIGFLTEGMRSVVKLTAYDFSIYGGLKGILEHISADTTKNEKGDSFYVVRIRTEKNYLGVPGNEHKIMPGMQTNVDIITGQKTVMQYLLKPLLRAKMNALTER